MRERDPASREREADLAGVEMPREDQVERARRDPPHDPGKVAEQQPQRPPRAEFVRPGLVTPVGLGVDTHDDDLGTAHLDGRCLVAEKSGALEIPQLGGLREGIARDGHVVVSEDDERGVERR